MFKNPVRIISITKDKVIAIEVLDAASKKFGKSFEFGWSLTTLDLVLSEVTKKFNTHTFRILVTDDLSYIVRLTVPPEIKRENTREYIREKLEDKVPDTVDDEEWDYKEVKSESSEGKDVICFVLVKRFARSLTGAITKNHLDIEAVESEVISKTRDANAYIGLAMKQDLTGKDEDTLNLRPGVTESNNKVESPKPIQESKPKTEEKSNVKVLSLILLVVIIFGVVAGIFIYRANLKKSTSVSTPTPEATAIVVPTPTPSETSKLDDTKTEKLDLSSLTVQIQNGSGVKGAADEAAKLLQGVGFTKTETGNASEFGHEDTTVSAKEKYKTVFGTIEQALSSDYTVVEGDALSDGSNFDVVVVVGTKK